jgi:hypothetical protein
LAHGITTSVGTDLVVLVYEVATFVGTVVLGLVDQVANYVGTVVTVSAHELLYFCEHKYSDLISQNTVEPLITDTAGEFKFCPL